MNPLIRLRFHQLIEATHPKQKAKQVPGFAEPAHDEIS